MRIQVNSHRWDLLDTTLKLGDCLFDIFSGDMFEWSSSQDSSFGILRSCRRPQQTNSLVFLTLACTVAYKGQLTLEHSMNLARCFVPLFTPMTLISTNPRASSKKTGTHPKHHRPTDLTFLPDRFSTPYESNSSSSSSAGLQLHV